MSLRLLSVSSERAAHAFGLSNTIPDADRIAARRKNARRLIGFAGLHSMHALLS